eukprot:m.126017 g.126017  ORF g.126017 m.126017 type:complete len:874 (-) comp16328_c0_seq3:294-2915(-)
MRDKKDEESAHSNPFAGLEKSRVLQEARVFNEMPINPRKCTLIITKILFLIYQGETIGQTEATETFFAMTKLFQNKDPTLRKMVYLAIKEMSTIADDVIIVTSSLTKDMTGKEDVYRAGAIRALTAITDASMLQGIERYMKQNLVDKTPAVQSATLVSALHLMKENAEVVKRWVNEVTQALNSKAPMAQYHALGLLYAIKQKDRLAVSKLVVSQMKSSAMRSPHAYCLLIRYAVKVIEDDPTNADRSLNEFLESCLRNKSEMVIYEAARALVNLPNVSQREQAQAVSVLQLLLSSPKPTLRFAAVRTLNKVAMAQPAALKACHLDMENLITDSNRSIATLAITTLLKIGNEGSIDRLMRQISTFMSEISDEFKIVVIDAIKSLCLKFPKKHSSLMSFLSSALRDEGGHDFKKAIIDTIISLVENIPEARESGLAQLCEFIEDCEFPDLLSRILHMLGQQGPRSPVPSKYIRFIYNRLILENSTVRAASVSALTKFGAQCEGLKESVCTLLRRCIFDGDDEVRDRACFCLRMLEDSPPPTVSKFLVNTLPLSLAGLERALLEYTSKPADAPFDLRVVPIETAPVRVDPILEEVAGISTKAKTEAAHAPSSRDVYQQQLMAIPAFASYGPLFKSSVAVDLTEKEVEYSVRCVKHIFATRAVFEFILINTLNDQKLENVKVVLSGGDQEIDAADVVTVPCPELPFEKPGVTYISIPLDPSIGTQSFSATMDFVVKDCDPETGECDEEGYPDSYQLEDVELALADLMQPVDKPNFGSAWEAMAEACEREDTFALTSMENITDAVNKIVSFLGMAACEKSNKVNVDRSSHTLLLGGVFVGGHEVLARARLAFDQGVNLQLTVRSADENTCDVVLAAVG